MLKLNVYLSNNYLNNVHYLLNQLVDIQQEKLHVEMPPIYSISMSVSLPQKYAIDSRILLLIGICFSCRREILTFHLTDVWVKCHVMF